MTRKHYRKLAIIVGQSLAEAYSAAEAIDRARNGSLAEGRDSGEFARTAVYGTLYQGMIAMLAEDNPRFDETRFADATAQAERAHRAALRPNG